MARRRNRSRRARRQLALVGAWLVVAQHALLNVVFVIDPYRPALINVPELWAMSRKWQFYLLIAIVAGTGAMTAAAWRLRAPVRLTLMISWTIFLVLMWTMHRERIEVMIRLMIQHGWG